MSEQIPKKVGNLRVDLRVGAILVEKKMTVADFAAATGLTYKTASDIAKNRRDRIGLETLALICDALNVAPSDVFIITKAE